MKILIRYIISTSDIDHRLLSRLRAQLYRRLALGLGLGLWAKLRARLLSGGMVPGVSV